MASYTKLLQVSKQTYQETLERDNQQCLFCKIGYKMPVKQSLAIYTLDAMHFINKSKMGLGIAKNLVIGCRHHHHMLDNGKNGFRKEMLDIMKSYLQAQYNDWNEESLRYKKYENL